MDIGKALTFFTEDERWVEKMAIGTGVAVVSLVLSPVLIGIVGFLIIAGYSVRLLQRVRDGNPTPLPEWDQWGDDLIRGFKLAVVAVVWSLPLIIFAIPTSIGRAMVSGNGGAGDAFGGLVAACGGCLSFLYSLVILVMAAGFTITYARDEEISSGLQITEIWQWTRRNLGQVVIVAVAYAIGSGVLFVVAGIAGVLLCVIGLLITIPLALLASMLFRAHLYGQLAREFPLTDSFTVNTSPIPPSGV
jgi:cytochrome b561